MGIKLDLRGQTFHYLTVIAKAQKLGNHIRWNCLCRCGAETTVSTSDLRSNHTKSCGCWNVEVHTKRLTTHGDNRKGKRATEYETYHSMIARCYNPNRDDYARYGGRENPITVCDRWRNCYEHFLEDMGRKPFAGAEIDRKNNDLGYFPSNCHWTTRKANGRNKRNNRILEFEGRTMTLTEWAEEKNMDMQRLWDRIVRYEWSVERALTTPVRQHKI